MSLSHLKSIIHQWVLKKEYHSLLGDCLVDHTDYLEDGCIFVDLTQDIRVSQRHWQVAREKGAMAIITHHQFCSDMKELPIVYVPDLKKQIPDLAACFYGFPASQMFVFGVTGTNGKTSVAHMLASCLHAMGEKVGYIGTLGYTTIFDLHDKPRFKKTITTTPSAVQLQRILAEFNKLGASSVCMEISSHGIVQGRIKAIPIDIAAFTNLSRDHLDFHKTMFDYGKAKKRLFTDYSVNHSLINVTDPLGESIFKDASGVKFSVAKEDTADGSYKIFQSSSQGLKFVMTYRSKSYTIQSKLIGDFNAENMSIVWMTLVVMGYDPDVVTEVLSNIRPLPGRMQICPQQALKPIVVVDYAHTPSSLEKALTVLKKFTQKKLWCVFGCGGDRDRGKRALMGQIAERLADRVVITQDNSRSEDPDVIASDILNGMICPWAAEMDMERQDAIVRAIHDAEPGDIILIAGRGHESHLVIGDNLVPCDDFQVACHALGVACVESV